MHAYFFDIYDGKSVNVDDFGDGFDSVQEAAEQARALLTEVLREEPLGGTSQDFGISVRNQDGDDVYRAALFFRDSYLDPNDLAAAQAIYGAWPIHDPSETIRQSRALRAQARQSALDIKKNRELLAEARSTFNATNILPKLY